MTTPFHSTSRCAHSDSTAHQFSSCLRLSSRCLLLCAVAFSVVTCTGPSIAQTIHDSGTWLSVNTQGDVESVCREHDCMRWWFDGHLRFADDAGGYYQSIIRPGLGYQLSDTTTLWAGYAWINESPVTGNPNFDENRVWQQLTWSQDLCRSSVSTRSRLEQRFVETGSDVGWRFRQFAKIDRPIGFESRLSAVVWDEVFFDLNSTDWGQHGGFSQNRVFAGLGWKFNTLNHPKVEIGYFNQFLLKRSSSDRFTHIVAVNWFWNF